MRELFARLHAVAPADSTVLITGETGTGKALAAEALHQQSPRRNGPFVVLDCGAIPTNLMESEAFGYERGAFTGATATHIGTFERADGGILFLAEVGALPLGTQPKLLRALARREVRRIGGSEMIPVNIRVVAATNRDLAVEVTQGRFREDLYYRLAVACVEIPPLRARQEDIPLLVEDILGGMPEGLTRTPQADTIELFKRHEWPGNVRELRNVLERALLFNQPWSELMSPPSPRPPTQPRTSVVPLNDRGPTLATTQDSTQMTVTINPFTPYKLAKQEMTVEFERQYIQALLTEHTYNVSAAARAAGIDRMSIHKMLKRLGFPRRKRKDD
jgi:transcriptional regulator with GAF, ATPase, and Fis domain